MIVALVFLLALSGLGFALHQLGYEERLERWVRELLGMKGGRDV
ncbi:MAG: hypothetical protein ACOYW9_09780 [Deinococcota bacterium]